MIYPTFEFGTVQDVKVRNCIALLNLTIDQIVPLFVDMIDGHQSAVVIIHSLNYTYLKFQKTLQIDDHMTHMINFTLCHKICCCSQAG